MSVRDPAHHSAVEARKGEHLRVTASRDVNTRTGPGWADIHLIHEALPEVDLDAVDVSEIGRAHV